MGKPSFSSILSDIETFREQESHVGFIKVYRGSAQQAEGAYRYISRMMIDLKKRIEECEARDWVSDKDRRSTEESIHIEWRRVQSKVKDVLSSRGKKERLPRNFEESMGLADTFFGGVTGE